MGLCCPSLGGPEMRCARSQTSIDNVYSEAALLQVSCDFCRETYTFGEQEVMDALPAEG